MTTSQTLEMKSSAKRAAEKRRDLQNISETGVRNSNGPVGFGEADCTVTDLWKDKLNFYPELKEAKDIRDFRQGVRTIIERLGFSDFAFVRGHCAGNELPLITSPQAHIDEYHNSGFYKYDFIEEYRKDNTRSAFMSRLYQPAVDAPYDIETLRANNEIYEVNQSFGYFDYYYTFMNSSHDGENVMFAVSRQGMDPVNFQRYAMPYEMTLKILSQAIDCLSIKKFSSHFLIREKDEVIKITPQPLRVLAALANCDMTITQLSDKLSISPVTIHQHIATARKTLGTRTNIGAIKKAIKLGLITYDHG